ncbi:MAG TPA: hypothetical protein VGK73_37690 [Polyangiaceae bacterium]
MRVSSFSKSWFVLVALLTLVGCGSSPEEICEDGCEWVNRCNDADIGTLDCAEESDDMKECVQTFEDLSDDCQDAYGDLYDCVNDVDSCEDSEILSECGGEFGDVLENCSDENDPFA